jgi:hypothetical protein
MLCIISIHQTFDTLFITILRVKELVSLLRDGITIPNYMEKHVLFYAHTPVRARAHAHTIVSIHTLCEFVK